MFTDTQYALELENRNPVLEGICKKLNIETNDLKSVRKELNKCYRNIGIEEGAPRSVRNWINGKTRPSKDYDDRKGLYTVCVALGLDLDETKEIFLKYYLTIPFIYKNRIDILFYYGIKNKLEYNCIVSLIDEID